jgi:hypothetical protein
MKSFLIPITTIRIVDFLSKLDNNFTKSNSPTNFIFAKNGDGTDFIVELKNNKHKNIDSEFVETFLKTKAESILKKDFQLKVKQHLENDDKELEYIEKYCDDNNLNRKDGREWEKKHLEEKSFEMALSNKIIKEGSIVRLPLSYNGKNKAIYNGTEYPIYDSLCLISTELNGEEKPSNTGLFYIAQTRHEFPLKLIKNKKDIDKFNVITDSNLMTLENILTLFRHSIRTVNKKNGFYLYFLITDEIKKDAILLDLIENLNSPNKTEEEYIQNIEKLIEMINIDNDIHKSLTMFLPFKLFKKEILRDTEMLINKVAAAIINISLSTQLTTKEEKDNKLIEVKAELEKNIMNNKYSLLAVYSILSLTEEIESDTYGFLQNNVKKSSITLSNKDLIDLIDLFKEKRLIENGANEVKQLELTGSVLEF